VLVTDDDPIARTLATAILTKAGHEVVAVEDGEQALAALEHDGPFNLLVLDLGLPGMDGRSVLRAVRSDRANARVAIIVLTGSEDVGDEVEMMREGADDYIRKPIDRVRFVARSEAAMRRLSIGGQ
jgi:two-component system response regulator QseB